MRAPSSQSLFARLDKYPRNYLFISLFLSKAKELVDTVGLIPLLSSIHKRRPLFQTRLDFFSKIQESIQQDKFLVGF